MWRHIASNALSLLIVVLVVVGGVIAWGKAQYDGAGPLEQAICLRVKSGATMTRVSEDLAARGAISNASIFRIGATYAEKSEHLKAGSFLVPAGASMVDIVDIVTRGGASSCGTEVVYRIGIATVELQVRELDPATNRFRQVLAFDPALPKWPAQYDQVRAENDTRYRISLAEGATSWQIMQALRRADFLFDSGVATPPEGSLAPDSYEVRRGDNVSETLDRMQSAQAARLDAAWQNRARGLPIKSPQEALTLASIVEKETGVPEERPQVASVFINRLNLGMRLQTDPSVIYGVTGGQGALGRGLRQSELRKETPYNTYVIEGLPPTPIANPGNDAIKAALNPAQTDYIFFVADGTGGHAFAATLKEHQINVAAWRAIEAAKSDN